MGGSSKSETQQSSVSQTTPYANAQPAINSILGAVNNLIPQATQLTGAQQSAINQLEQNANNPYAGLLGNLAANLLNAGGPNGQGQNIQNTLSTYQAQLSPYANGQNIGPNGNPALQGYLNTAATDARDQINSLFAGAGRDLSGAHIQALSRGITQAEAPILANQYNTDVANQLNAANSLYGAGNTTAGLLSGLNLSGADAANAALAANTYAPNQILSAEALRSSLPIQNAGLLASIAAPIGQAFGTNFSNGTSQTTQTASPLQTFLGITTGLGALFRPKS